MDCDPGASLYFGVNRAVTPEEFRKRIEDNTVEEVLNRVEVHPGTRFFGGRRLTPSEDTAAVPEEKPISGGSVARLGKCKYFTTDRFTVDDEIELTVDGGSFMSMTSVEGCGRVIGPENAVDFAPGDTLFIPAGTGTVAVKGRCALVAVGIEGE